MIICGGFTIVPFEAGAQSVTVKTWDELVSAVSSGNAVVLGADITGKETDAFLDIAEGGDIVIDLNGYTLSRGAIGKDDPGYVFKIDSNATLTVADSSGYASGKIAGGSSTQGGAFYNKGTLTIEGGSICNNYSSEGGGAVYNTGTFHMSGGVICNNVSANGGAVYNASNGVVTLSGTAKLTGNESNTYGGGAVTNYGRLTILDAAELSQNKAFTRGGAIWTGGNSTLELYGGVITQNSAGLAGSGVYDSDGTLNMKGSPQVRFNDADDLFLCNGRKITVTGRLVPSYASPGDYHNVGIITSGSDRVITAGYAQYNPDVTNPYLFFFTRDYHELVHRDGGLYSESFKTTYVFRQWDPESKKVCVGFDYAENVVDVSTLTDDVSVGMHSGNWYIVRGNVTITHRLNIVGTANLILGDGATLRCTDGIRSERKLNSVLNIYTQAEGTGKLIAETEARDWAAIGGRESGDAGTLNVYGGNIVAKGLRSGIAGGTNIDGDGGAGGPVAIYGGEVRAEVSDGGASGAAIGGANTQSGGAILINNGTVNATGGSEAAGIGGGKGASSGSITINGGTVNATGGYSGAAIGSGKNGSLDSVTVNGGTVYAVPGSFGTGIGGGQYSGGGTVDINGGAVTVTDVLNTQGIGAGTGGVNTTVTLNWTDDTKDTMSVVSYRSYDGTVKLNRPFEDKSSGAVFYQTSSADNTALTGKTLTPYTKLFTGHSFTLNGDIGVNFFLNLTDEQAARTTISFSWFNKTLSDMPVEAVSGSPGIYRASCPVAVAEMTYAITATVKINDVLQEETDQYMVVSYADVILNDQEFINAYVKEHGAQKYEKLSTLVKTMLDYGAKAQFRFDRDINNPANGGTDFYTDSVTIVNHSDDMTAELEKCGLSYVGSSVIYLSQTMLRHYYRITEPDRFTQEVRDDITFDGMAAAYGERNGTIYFDKKDIAASQLDTEYVIEINGNAYHYAVLDYIARAYNDASASQIEKELAAAVYRYNAAANAYFGS